MFPVISTSGGALAIALLISLDLAIRAIERMGR